MTSKHTSILYELVKLPSEEPVCYVGVYVLKWGKVNEPSVGFKEVKNSAPELLEALKNLVACDLRKNLLGGYDEQIENAEQVIARGGK